MIQKNQNRRLVSCFPFFFIIIIIIIIFIVLAAITIVAERVFWQHQKQRKTFYREREREDVWISWTQHHSTRDFWVSYVQSGSRESMNCESKRVVFFLLLFFSESEQNLDNGQRFQVENYSDKVGMLGSPSSKTKLNEKCSNLF